MNIIKNIHLLKHLPEKDILRLEQSALLHLRYSNIHFKITEAIGKVIKVAVRQEKPFSGNAATAKRLIEIVHETFDFTGLKVHVGPTAYKPNPVDEVDAEWLTGQMEMSGIKLKTISADTGISNTNISAWANGKRPMSQIVKAFFFYYFSTKPPTKQKK